MSGGHYNGDEYKCLMLAEEIDEDIQKYKKECSAKIISKMNEAQHCLRKSYEMVKLIDYLISGDIGEKSFHKRWREELKLLRKNMM